MYCFGGVVPVRRFFTEDFTQRARPRGQLHDGGVIATSSGVRHELPQLSFSPAQEFGRAIERVRVRANYTENETNVNLSA
jgi:hypothetical protein